MKKIISFLGFIFYVFFTQAQENKWALGFMFEDHLGYKNENAKATFGIQSSYNFTNNHGLQAQVHGRTDYVGVGADYLLSIFDRSKNNFNITPAVGLSGDFISNFDPDTNFPNKVRERFFLANAQIMVSYYFPAANLSLYAGYKTKYNITSEKINPNFLTLGFRYHLW